MALARILPAPLRESTEPVVPNDPAFRAEASGLGGEVPLAPVPQPLRKTGPPPYGQRQGWVPRSDEDFGGGGAFPEIHVAQFPLGMGRRKAPAGKTLALQVDAEGKVQYGALAKQGHGRGATVHTTLAQQRAKDVSEPIERPGEDEVEATRNRTAAALEAIAQVKLSAAQPVKPAGKLDEPVYVRYTPAQQGPEYASGAAQRIIKISEMPIDPMEPPKFKTNRKIPGGPPSPPAPVMHSPPRKVSVEEQRDWKVPPSISSWKNPRGYTVPLDKRLAADGRGLVERTINDKFAKFAESLYIADRQARDAVETRMKLEKRLAQKEKEKQEERLREMATRAREERAGLVGSALAARDAGPAPEDGRERRADRGDDDEGAGLTAEERDRIREERHRDRERERRLQRMAPDRRTAMDRARERDVTEKIALGLPARTAAGTSEAYDQRLFNQSQGLSSGFAGGDDEGYNVYDRPMGLGASRSDIGIYRPRQGVDQEVYGGDVDAVLKRTDRFQPDKGFQGASDNSGRGERDGPVEFTREPEPADLFGLDKFLTEAKEGGRRALDGIGQRGGLAAAGSSAASLREGGGSSRDRIAFRSEGGDAEAPPKRPRHK